jgi:hypothetical protein
MTTANFSSKKELKLVAGRREVKSSISKKASIKMVLRNFIFNYYSHDL